MKRNAVLGITLVAVIAALGIAQACAGQPGASDGSTGPAAINTDYSAEGMAPMFEVDPFWPKPLPNHWLQGASIGVAVDSRDHVWTARSR